MARPRKSGERYPSGDLKPVKDEMPGATIRRIVELARNKAADPMLASPIGWLHLNGKITAIQVEAATIYQGQRQKYDSGLGLPSRSARSCDLNSGGGGYSEGRDGRKARQGYERTRDAIFASLGHDTGSKAISALDHAIIELQAIADWQLNPLKAGLYVVAELHGLAGTGRRVINRK